MKKETLTLGCLVAAGLTVILSGALDPTTVEASAATLAGHCALCDGRTKPGSNPPEGEHHFLFGHGAVDECAGDGGGTCHSEYLDDYCFEVHDVCLPVDGGFTETMDRVLLASTKRDVGALARFVGESPNVGFNPALTRIEVRDCAGFLAGFVTVDRQMVAALTAD